MYIFDVAVLEVGIKNPTLKKNLISIIILLQLTEPIPEEHLAQVVLEDRPCSTTYQQDAQLIGWGRNEVIIIFNKRKFAIFYGCYFAD